MKIYIKLLSLGNVIINIEFMSHCGVFIYHIDLN